MFYPYITLNYKILTNRHLKERIHMIRSIKTWNTITVEVEYPPELTNTRDILDWGIEYGENNPIDGAHFDSVTLRKLRSSLAHSQVYDGKEN